MNRLMREIIGRSTMLVLGVAMLLGGWRCWTKGRELIVEWDQHHPPTHGEHVSADDRARNSGAYYVDLLAWLLLLGGAITAAAAVLPVAMLPGLMSVADQQVPPIKRVGTPARRP
jgi:hypothetical protein